MKKNIYTIFAAIMTIAMMITFTLPAVAEENADTVKHGRTSVKVGINLKI